MKIFIKYFYKQEKVCYNKFVRRERMATPHNTASKGEIAKCVILTGDPRRAKKIKDKIMPNAKLVNSIREIKTYTGKVNGKELTIMAHGMGCPSMGIYAHELFDYYGVEKIVRIGTIGALKKEIPLKSIIIAEESFTKTNFDGFYIKNGANFVKVDSTLVQKAKKICKEEKLKNESGKIYCSDNFYTEENQLELAEEYDLLGVEMETAALYLTAQKFNRQAVALCLVSDNIVTKKSIPAEEKEDMFDNLSKVAVRILFDE